MRGQIITSRHITPPTPCAGKYIMYIHSRAICCIRYAISPLQCSGKNLLQQKITVLRQFPRAAV